MRIKFLGTGKTEMTGNEKNNRKVSSIFFNEKNTNIIVNLTKNFNEQITGIDSLDGVLLTNSLEKNIEGITNLVEWLSDQEVQTIDIYCDDKTWSKISNKYGNTMLNPIIINESEFMIDDLKIQSFWLGDSLGFKINDFVVANDVDTIPKESEKYFENSYIIMDSTYDLNEIIEFDKYNPQKIFLNQIEYPHEEMEKLSNSMIDIVYDNYELSIESKEEKPEIKKFELNDKIYYNGMAGKIIKKPKVFKLREGSFIKYSGKIGMIIKAIE